MRIAWGLAAATAALVGVRCAQGCWPDRGISCPLTTEALPRADVWWMEGLGVGLVVTIVAGLAGAKRARVDRGALLIYLLGLFATLSGAWLNLAPEGAASPVATICAIALAILIAPLCVVFVRQGTERKRLVVPGLAQATCGVLLYLSHPAEWQTCGWERSDDPRVLWRAAESVERDVRMTSGHILSRHHERAAVAYGEIQERLVAMGPRAIAALLEPLAMQAWSYRVLRRLGAGARPVLVAAVGSPHAETRRLALSLALFLPCDPELQAAALSRFEDEDSEVRVAALRHFRSKEGSWNDTIGDAIIERLSDYEEKVRLQAARVCEERRYRRAVPALVACLERDGDRGPVFSALGEIGDPAAIPALAGWARGGDGGACAALWRLGGAGIEALMDLPDAPHVRKVLSWEPRGVVEYSPETRRRLAEWLQDADRRPAALGLLAHAADPWRAAAELRSPDGWRVLWVLRDRGHATADDVLYWFERWSPPRARAPGREEQRARQRVDGRFWRMGRRDRDLADGLARLAGNETLNWPLRTRAFEALGRIDPARARMLAEGREFPLVPWRLMPTSGVLRILKRRDSLEWNAARELADRSDAPDDVFVRALMDDDPRLHDVAAEAAGRRRLVNTVDRLITLIERRRWWHKSDRVVQAAVKGLAEIGDARAQAVLRRVRQVAWVCRDAEGYYAAESALLMCGDRESLGTLLAMLKCPLSKAMHKPDFEFALRAIARLGDVHLLRPLGDHGWMSAIELIGRERVPGAFDELSRYLEHRDTMPRRAAALGFGHLRDERAVPLLLRELDSEYVADYAIRALQQITGERWMEPYEEVTPEIVAAVRSWAARRGVDK